MAKEDTYKLERHAAETERLRVQNKAFIRAVGYLLHPSVQRELPQSPSIAELATGTGDFLVDLSKTLPLTARLDAFDISSDSFLPKEELPANVTLNVTDAREPPSDDHRGKYDIVCIRFLNAGLMPDDWQSVAEHAWALLKPGGALQWIEGDLLQTSAILRMEPETKTTALEKGAKLGISKQVQVKWFVTNLHSVLESVGFREVKQMISSSDRLIDGREAMSRLVVGAMYAALRLQKTKGVDGAMTYEEAAKLREEMMEEVENGAYVRADMHQFVAWKPE